MATKKPRLTITLDEDTYWVMKQFADLQGRSMSSVVNEILTEVSPSVARVGSYLARARELENGLMRGIADDLEAASYELGSYFDTSDIRDIAFGIAEKNRRA